MPDGTEYALSEQRNEEIFRDAIVPDELSHAQPQPRPTLVILIAQQGSGKTRTAHQLGVRLDDLGGLREDRQRCVQDLPPGLDTAAQRG